MKTAISIPDALVEAADALAARLGVSRSVLFQRAVEALLREYDDRSITEALNRVYATESPALDPVLAELQRASLSRTHGHDWRRSESNSSEVIVVLVPDTRAESTDPDAILRSADEWRSRHPERRTKESIDRELADERAAWGDR